MKRLFIVCLLVLLAGVALVAAIEYDPGYILISYGHYTLETSLWVGIAVFLLLFAVFYGCFSLLRRFINHSNALGQWFSGRKNRRSQRQTNQGLIAYIEGNWERARRTLARAAVQSETPLFNYLLAARASHQLGDAEKAKEFLSKAESTGAAASIAVELTQAELQLENGQYEQSLATLTRARRNAGRHPSVLTLLKEVYIKLDDWEGLAALLPALKKYNIVDKQELDQLELRTNRSQLAVLANHGKGSLNELTTCWQALPKSARHNSALLAEYVSYLLADGGDKEAEKLLRDQLKRDWSPALVSLYGRVSPADASKQLIHAEAWLKERTNDATLLLSLGRIALRNQLWGKAREYFESSLKLENSPETCAELGRLLSHLGDHEKGNDYFHRGLLLSTHGLPALPLPEK